jgi:hypothetical protein
LTARHGWLTLAAFGFLWGDYHDSKEKMQEIKKAFNCTLVLCFKWWVWYVMSCLVSLREMCRCGEDTRSKGAMAINQN